MPIIPHANGEPLLNAELLLFTFFPSWQQCCLSFGLQMVMAVLLLPRLVPIYLMTILTNSFVWVIVSSIRTNRTKYTLYKKILDLLEEENFSGESSGRASL